MGAFAQRTAKASPKEIKKLPRRYNSDPTEKRKRQKIFLVTRHKKLRIGRDCALKDTMIGIITDNASQFNGGVNQRGEGFDFRESCSDLGFGPLEAGAQHSP